MKFKYTLLISAIFLAAISLMVFIFNDFIAYNKGSAELIEGNVASQYDLRVVNFSTENYFSLVTMPRSLRWDEKIGFINNSDGTKLAEIFSIKGMDTADYIGVQLVSEMSNMSLYSNFDKPQIPYEFLDAMAALNRDETIYFNQKTYSIFSRTTKNLVLNEELGSLDFKNSNYKVYSLAEANSSDWLFLKSESAKSENLLIWTEDVPIPRDYFFTLINLEL